MDLTDYIDSFVEENNGEVSISDTAYHFFILGKKHAEEQMMKDTIDGTVFCESLKIPTIGHFLHKTNLKENDKVKVIIIKSE